ncbi:hypothetical protein HY440_02600 [Candidatus Microgenomates bacterium]|nr:hypothetical protein [Candidatus Microgenomates bacterium]
MATSKENFANPGLMLFATFVGLFVTNSVIIYLANSFFPGFVVLGTLAFTPVWAVFHSMLVLTLIDTFTIPFVHLYEKSRGKMFSSTEWMVAYFFVNLAGIWGVARFSEQFGLGIKSWLVAVALAIVLDFVQGVVMMQLQKLQPKLS